MQVWKRVKERQQLLIDAGRTPLLEGRRLLLLVHLVHEVVKDVIAVPARAES